MSVPFDPDAFASPNLIMRERQANVPFQGVLLYGLSCGLSAEIELWSQGITLPLHAGCVRAV